MSNNRIEAPPPRSKQTSGPHPASCVGKEAFTSAPLARKAAQRKPGREVYRCEQCGKFHVGTQNPKKWGKR